MNEAGVDTGQADPAVREALRTLPHDVPAEEAEMALLQLLAGSRFLLPVVAAPPAVAQAWAREGHDHESHADDPQHEPEHQHEPEPDAGAMAAVRLVAPDGRQGMPVFTGLDALAGWDDAARPLPMTCAETARMALEQGCDVLIVDFAEPHAHVLRSSMVWALAEQRRWWPAYRDELVLTAVESAGTGINGVVAVWVAQPGAADEPGTLVLEVRLAADLTREQVQAAAAELGERLASDPSVRCRLDGVRFVLRPHSSGWS